MLKKLNQLLGFHSCYACSVAINTNQVLCAKCAEYYYQKLPQILGQINNSDNNFIIEKWAVHLFLETAQRDGWVVGWQIKEGEEEGGYEVKIHFKNKKEGVLKFTVPLLFNGEL